MPIFPINDETIKQAAECIRLGGLAAFPTETVYGLGGDAFNPLALAKIFEAKGRPHFDPLIVHIADRETLGKAADISLLEKPAQKNLAALADKFWPGPLTLILPKQNAIPGLATSGLQTVAVRLPAHDAARKLIRLSTGAVAAPSANPFGYLSPTRAQHVWAMLADKAEIILDGGPAQHGLESTVLDVSAGQPRILRPGAVPKEAIEALIGHVACGTAIADSVKGAPGLLKSHYAPRIPLFAHNSESLQCESSADNAAFLFFDGASRDQWLAAHLTAHKAGGNISVLSETGNIQEAAARLFETLHELDQLNIAAIHAQFAPEEGLGVAINDRLHRAAAKYN